MPFSRDHKNRPIHLYQDDSVYFITANTYSKLPLFNSDKKKQIFKDILFRTIKAYNFILSVWIILNNHYHILMKVLIVT